MAGEHPANPWPQPDNWIELSRRVWHDHDAAPLLQSPWLRRVHFVYSGRERILAIALADLAAVPAFTPVTDADVAEMQRYVDLIQRGRGGWPHLVLVLPDGATAPATPPRIPGLVLAAYREVGVERLPVRLDWPTSRGAFDSLRWLITMCRGSTIEIQQAFTTGALPPWGS